MASKATWRPRSRASANSASCGKAPGAVLVRGVVRWCGLAPGLGRPVACGSFMGDRRPSRPWRRHAGSMNAPPSRDLDSPTMSDRRAARRVALGRPSAYEREQDGPGRTATACIVGVMPEGCRHEFFGVNLLFFRRRLSKFRVQSNLLIYRSIFP
jgi:hypothetical protein